MHNGLELHSSFQEAILLNGYELAFFSTSDKEGLRLKQ